MKNFIVLFYLLSLTTAFAVEVEELELLNEGCTLKGTLRNPVNQENSQTVVILIAGSGPTDRNGNNPQMTNNSLKMVSEGLAEKGFACFSYDKRGTAASKLADDFNAKDMSFEFFINDANAWVDLFANDARFNKIVLAGHSQGSLVAMCVANKNKNVDAVISLAGAGRPIHEVLKKQLAATLSIEMQGLVNAKLDTLAMGDTLKDSPQMLYSIMHPTIQPFLISWIKYNPAEEIAKLKIPLLLINGTTDIQVALEEMEILANANPSATAIKIKNMNHILKTIKGNDMGEQLELYDDPEAELNKKLIPILSKFLHGLN